ncbi:unnamed protein product, partial [marine sediment metagenome]
ADIAAAPTTPAYNVYYSRPSDGDKGAGVSITPAGTVADVPATAQGYIWMDIYGGSDFYIIESAFRTANPRVRAIVVEDWDLDGKEDFLVQLYVGDVGVTGQGTDPTCTINLPLLDLDVTGLTSTNPGDQGSIGTSETVINIEWTCSAVTAQDGFVITEIYFKTNSTIGGDDILFEELELSGGHDVINPTTGRVKDSWVEPMKDKDGDYYAYYVDADTNNDPLAHGSLMAYRPLSGTDTLRVSINARMTMDGGDVILVDMVITYVGPTGTKGSITDQVMLSA